MEASVVSLKKNPGNNFFSGFMEENLGVVKGIENKTYCPANLKFFLTVVNKNGFGSFLPQQNREKVCKYYKSFPGGKTFDFKT